MQLELPLRNDLALEREIAALSGLRVRLTVTDNTRTVISVSKNRVTREVRLRLHHMFLNADAHVLHALAVWIKHPKDRDAAKAVDTFIRRQVLARHCGGGLLEKADGTIVPFAVV